MDRYYEIIDHVSYLYTVSH